jgi:hypothetical protein
MSAIDHHRGAHAALTGAHDYLALRGRHIDPESIFRTKHHEWIERYCVVMATVLIRVALRHRRRLVDRPD